MYQKINSWPTHSLPDRFEVPISDEKPLYHIPPQLSGHHTWKFSIQTTGGRID